MKISVVLILSCVFFAVGCSDKEAARQVAEMRLKLKNTEKALEATKEAVKTQEASSRALQGKIQQLTEVLTNSTAQLRTARERIAAYEAIEQSRLAQEEEQKAAAAQSPTESVPAPTVLRTNLLGTMEKLIIFPALLTRSGQTIASNVQYSATYGRRVVFVFPDLQRRAFDIDDLHPEILAHLGINTEEIKRFAAQKEQREQAFMASWFQQAAVKNAEAKKLAAERKAAAEKAAAEEIRLAEEQRRQEFNEWVQLQALENDRMRAEAAVQEADAAIMDALAPRVPAVINNVNSW